MDNGQQMNVGIGRILWHEEQVAKLMRYFKTADPNDMSQGDLSKWVRYLKLEEGGYKIMCAIYDKIYEEGRTEGRTEGREEGREEGRVQEREIWQMKMADKDAMLADRDALITSLRARLGEAV